MGVAMSDDRFFDQLRRDARPLRYEPDAVRVQRLEAAVRERVAGEPATVAQLLAMWFRPLAASLAALALAAALAVGFSGRNNDFSMEPVEVSVAGGSYSVAD
jgi:hypothetical protein